MSSSNHTKKLSSDLGNHLTRSTAIGLAFINPILAIICFSISLYFSWKHNLAHLASIEEKEKRQGTTMNLTAKAWIMLGRMGFDLAGVGLSIVVLLIELYWMDEVSDSLTNQLILVGAIGLIASSMFSTFHKIRRLVVQWWNVSDEGVTFTYGDTFRAVFGAASTAFLGCVIFEIIPEELLVHPISMAAFAVVILGMGYFKAKAVWEAKKEEYEQNLKVDDITPNTSLGNTKNNDNSPPNSNSNKLVLFNLYEDYPQSSSTTQDPSRSPSPTH